MRQAVVFVLVTAAFEPILDLSLTPIRIMFPRSVLEEAYSGEVYSPTQVEIAVSNPEIGIKFILLWMIFSGIFIWSIMRFLAALEVLYKISRPRATLFFLMIFAGKWFIETNFTGRLLLMLAQK